MNSFDRFLILPFMTLGAVGVYDFAIKCLVPVDLLLNGLNATLNPKVIKLINANPVKGSSPEINRYFYGLISVVLLAICLSIFGIPIAVNLFVDKTGYAAALQYIPYVGIIYVFKAMRLYFVIPFTVLKKMKRLTILNFVVNVIKVGMMALFISKWQLYGVIASAVLAFAVEIFLLWYFLREDYRVAFNGFKLMIAPFLMVLMILVAEPMFGTKLPILVHGMYGIIVVGLLWFAYRNEIRTLDPLKFLR
jgi:O-antigen/teichoic acid export membrane protein